MPQSEFRSGGGRAAWRKAARGAAPTDGLATNPVTRDVFLGTTHNWPHGTRCPCLGPYRRNSCGRLRNSGCWGASENRDEEGGQVDWSGAEVEEVATSSGMKPVFTTFLPIIPCPAADGWGSARERIFWTTRLEISRSCGLDYPERPRHPTGL